MGEGRGIRLGAARLPISDRVEGNAQGNGHLLDGALAAGLSEPFRVESFVMHIGNNRDLPRKCQENCVNKLICDASICDTKTYVAKKPKRLPQLTVPIDPREFPGLLAWLRKASKVMPHIPGKGKKETQKLAAYVRMVLAAHRKGMPVKIPSPDPNVIRAGEWFDSLSESSRGLALIVGESADSYIGEQPLEEAGREMFGRMVDGKLGRKGRQRKPKGTAT